jgi:mersacidin/lichenicidin family type 2 lantibiotic
MQEIDKIIRAWKDEDYRMSLSTDERQALPENPAGVVEFSGADLNRVVSVRRRAFLGLPELLSPPV